MSLDIDIAALARELKRSPTLERIAAAEAALAWATRYGLLTFDEQQAFVLDVLQGDSTERAIRRMRRRRLIQRVTRSSAVDQAVKSLPPPTPPLQLPAPSDGQADKPAFSKCGGPTLS